MAVKKLSEQGPIGQFFSVLAMIGISGSVVLSGLLWAADVRINQKYATDQDLANIKTTVNKKLGDLENAVRTNTDAIQEIPKSINTLMLGVITLQISDIERVISEMEQRQNSWTSTDAATFREKKRALRDLNTQRDSLISRINSK